MIRIKEIQDALTGVVGWEQGCTVETTIDDRLTETESGLYYQQAHPLVTLENVSAIMPEDYAERYPVWVAGSYDKGKKVRHGAGVWRSTVDGNDSEPATPSASGWEPFNPLTDYVETMTRGSIAKTVQTFLQTKSLIEDDSAGVTVRLEKIGLQMTGATGTVRLYVFHSSQREAQHVIDFVVSKGDGSMEWMDLRDCYLPYKGDTGAWYVVYSQADLPQGMEAVNVTKYWSREPCGTCNRGVA